MIGWHFLRCSIIMAVGWYIGMHWEVFKNKIYFRIILLLWQRSGSNIKWPSCWLGSSVWFLVLCYSCRSHLWKARGYLLMDCSKPCTWKIWPLSTFRLFYYILYYTIHFSCLLNWLYPLLLLIHFFLLIPWISIFTRLISLNMIVDQQFDLFLITKGCHYGNQFWVNISEIGLPRL